MSHSLTEILIHGVFSTKDRQPIIINNHETDLYNHIKIILINDFGCFIKSINGTVDHIHILFLLNPNYSCSDIFKNLKGESSHWWNQQKFSKTKFAW
jgi:REP element-mobilizing transposase RayT